MMRLVRLFPRMLRLSRNLLPKRLEKLRIVASYPGRGKPTVNFAEAIGLKYSSLRLKKSAGILSWRKMYIHILL